MFEAYVAAASFTLWISFFYFLKTHRSCKKWRFPSRHQKVAPFEESDFYTLLSLPVYLGAISFYHTFVKTKTRPPGEGAVIVLAVHKHVRILCVAVIV